MGNMKYIKGQELFIKFDSSGHRLKIGSSVVISEVNKYDYLALTQNGIEVYINEQDLKTL